MNRIKRKLKSRGGASVLIALVGFMAAAMISMVVVTAAVTAAERVADDRTSNQAHLTLESAARIVAEEIEGTTYTFTAYDDSGKIVYGGVSCTGGFAAEMKIAVQAVDSSGANYSGENCCTVSLSAGADVPAVDKVSVSYVMSAGTEASDEKYDLTFTLTIPDSQQELYVTVNGSCTTTKDKDGKYNITWDVVSINTLA